MSKLVEEASLLVEIIAQATQLVDQVLVGKPTAAWCRWYAESRGTEEVADGDPECFGLCLEPLVVVRLETDSDEAAELDGHGAVGR